MATPATTGDGTKSTKHHCASLEEQFSTSYLQHDNSQSSTTGSRHASGLAKTQQPMRHHWYLQQDHQITNKQETSLTRQVQQAAFGCDQQINTRQVCNGWTSNPTAFNNMTADRSDVAKETTSTQTSEQQGAEKAIPTTQQASTPALMDSPMVTSPTSHHARTPFSIVTKPNTTGRHTRRQCTEATAISHNGWTNTT